MLKGDRSLEMCLGKARAVKRCRSWGQISCFCEDRLKIIPVTYFLLGKPVELNLPFDKKPAAYAVCMYIYIYIYIYARSHISIYIYLYIHTS